MRHNDWPRLAGLASFALLAIGCAAFLISSGDVARSVTGVAILLLAVGQIIYMVSGWMQLSRYGDRLSAQGKALRDLSGRTAAAAERMAQIEAKLATPIATMAPPQRNDSAIQEMQALRQQLKALAEEIQKPLDGGAPAPAGNGDAAPRATPRERLDLLLEPIVELANGETAHYRALLHMVDDSGSEVSHAELMRRAEQGGARARLDVHLVDQALPVFRRLRQKHPVMRLFLPIGVATLTNAADLGRIVGLLEESRDVAAGLVIEIAHADLASLSAHGVEGLAQLARLGVTMSLTRVSLTGLDLTSLRQLGVRFLDIDARSIDAGFGVAPAWNDFAQFARSLQFQMVGGHVETSAQSQAAARLARFGYGPYFAPPRRVRSGAGQGEATSRFQAA